MQVTELLTFAAKKGPWTGVVGVGRWALPPRPVHGQAHYGHCPLT